MRLLITAIFLSLLIGCSTVDYQLTAFRANKTNGANQTYTFSAFADAVYPKDSEVAEKQRMEWLEKWLSQNNLPTNNYKVLSRETYLKSKGLLGTTYDIYYTVEVPKN
jgi:hypothetical protein